MIGFNCPNCTRSFQVEDAMAGRTLSCPDCRSQVTVPGTAAPAGGGPAKKSATGLAVTSLVLGIIGLLTFCACGAGAVPALIAVILGFMAMSKTKNPEYSPDGRGLAIGGLITGMISVGLAIAFIAMFGFSAIWAKKEVKKLETEIEKAQAQPWLMESTKIERADGGFVVECSMTSASGNVQADGELRCTIYTWDDDDTVGTLYTSIEANATKVTEQTFKTAKGDKWHKGAKWTLSEKISVPKNRLKKFVTAVFRYKPTSAGTELKDAASRIRVE